MDHTKIDQTDLDSSRQEVSVRGLRFVVHRSFGFRGIDFCLRLLGVRSNPALLAPRAQQCGTLVRASGG